MSIDNVKTIQETYQAFGAGDVAAIQARCTPDTRWGFAAAYPEAVSWHRPVEGRDGLPRFFGDIGQAVEFQAFELREFVHCGPHVLVEVHLAYTVRATGAKVEMDQVHWWTLDPDGRIANMRHFEDSAQVLQAVAA